jgi:hypothetical protein
VWWRWSKSHFSQRTREMGHPAAEAALLTCALYAALKRRSFTVPHRSVIAAGEIDVKIKVKGIGQECPIHTCVPTKVDSTFVDFTFFHQRVKVE